MKKIIFYIALAVSAIACTTPNAGLPQAEKGGALNIMTGDIAFNTDGGSSTLIFVASADWTARVVHDNSTNKEEWCTIDVKSGVGDESVNNTITVTASANSNYSDRSAKVYVTSGNFNKYVTVTQTQFDVINVINPQYNVTAEGETINVEIKSNITNKMDVVWEADWVKRIEQENASRAYTSSQWRFKVTPNTTGAERQAEIHFIYKNIDEKVTIIQAAESNQTEE